MEFITPLLQWLNANPSWAGFATFIISAAESVAIIGTIVPGTVTMAAIGALAGAGIIPLWSTIVWAICGAVLGDGISYWLGHYFKDHLKNAWPFKNNPHLLARGEHFVLKYGVMSVFIGRFVGPVRALVPMVAGMLGMKPLQFTIANIASAIGWAPAYLFPGLVIGALSQEFPTDVAMHSLLVLLLIGLFIILCVWSSLKFLSFLQTRIESNLNYVWKNVFKRFSLLTQLLQHHDEKNHRHGQLVLAFYWISATLCLIALCFYVHAVSVNHITLNRDVYHLFRGMRFPLLDSILISITLLGQKEIIALLALIMTAWFLYCKRYRTASLLFLLTVFSGVINTLLKYTLHVPRPEGIAYVSSYSMPSGHTTLSTAFYLGIAFFLAYPLAKKYQKLVYTPVVLLILAVGFSRLYLGAHWFTDVIAGWLTGLSILFFSVIIYLRTFTLPVPFWSSLLVFIIALSVSLFGYEKMYFADLKNRYAMLQPKTVLISKQQWLQQTDVHAHIRLMGFPFDYINIKWMGNANDIKKTLLEQKWSPAPERDWLSVAYRLTDINSGEYLPIMSPLYRDKQPDMVFVRQSENSHKLLVLRLWNSYFSVKENGLPIWFGHVSVVPRSYAWIVGKQKLQVNVSVKRIFAKDKKASAAWQSTARTISTHPTQFRTVLFIEPSS